MVKMVHIAIEQIYGLRDKRKTTGNPVPTAHHQHLRVYEVCDNDYRRNERQIIYHIKQDASSYGISSEKKHEQHGVHKREHLHSHRDSP